LAKSTPILINFFTDGLPLCGAPATTPWHYDAVEERPSTSSCEAGHMTAPDRLARTLIKPLAKRGRPHMTRP
jgi:hypothetical protein